LIFAADSLSSFENSGSVSWITAEKDQARKVVQLDVATRRKSEWPIPLGNKEHVSYLRVADATHYFAVAIDEGEKAINVYDLHRDGSEIKKIGFARITYASDVFDSNIARNGKALALTVHEPNAEAIVIYQLDTKLPAKEIRSIKDAVHPGGTISLDWDNKSENLAYSDKGHINVFNIRTGNITSVGNARDARWLPNGNLLAYADNARGFVVYDTTRKTQQRLGIKVDTLLRDYVSLSNGEVIAVQTKSPYLVTLNSDIVLIHMATKKTMTIAEKEFILRLVH
jgi:hypothetical protein